MAAGPLNIYAANVAALNINDLLTATVKMALVTASYSPDFSATGHNDWADVSAFEIANGGGYTTGGVTLTSKSATAITDGWRFNSANVQWVSSGGGIATWRRGVMYVSGTLWGVTNPLIGAFLGDETPANILATTAGQALNIFCPSAGWLDIVKTT